jgi:CheY-like chemotaxis protein
VDLNDLVENVTHMFQRARKEIQVITSLEPELWPVECDSIQIEQVVLNLLVNAWHAMSDGGVITVETENCRRCEGVLGQEEKCVKLLISDTGKGMDSETKSRIFEPFFSTRKQEAGTGLGLTTAFAIVERHGGAIEVDSEPGKGTTFEIYFPATTAVAGETEKENPRMLSGKETILLIDDEEMIIDVGSQMIELMGYQVMTAETGKNALEVFSENRDRIDLIILDLIMPDMSGRKVFESLRELKPDIKILISSGYSMEGEVKDLLNTGGDAFLQKPFNMNMLSEKIREVLDLEGKEEYCKRG